MALTQAAQRKYKVREHAGDARLEVAGRALQLGMEDSWKATYTLSDEGGSSEMTIASSSALEPHEGARAKLLVGYGDELVEWFEGKIEEPEDSHWGELSEATAWGPGRELLERTFYDPEQPGKVEFDYQNEPLGSALLDIYKRANRKGANVRLLIEGRAAFVLTGEEAIFSLDAKYGEAVDAVCKSANYIGTDLPGYTRKHLPRPRPGGTGKAAARYDEGHYPPGAFRVKPAARYGSVLIFSRLESGEIPWVVYRPVNYPDKRIATDRSFIIGDFLGTEADAKREGQTLTANIARSWEWTLEGIAANPDLLPLEQIECEATDSGFQCD